MHCYGCYCTRDALRYIRTCAERRRTENWLQHKSLHAFTHARSRSGGGVGAKSALQQIGPTLSFPRQLRNRGLQTIFVLKSWQIRPRLHRVCVNIPAVAERECQNPPVSAPQPLRTCVNIALVSHWGILSNGCHCAQPWFMHYTEDTTIVQWLSHQYVTLLIVSKSPPCCLYHDKHTTMASPIILVLCYLHFLNTLRQRKMDAISQTTFSSAFSWMKMFEFRLKFHWNLFLRVQLTIFQHWFR